MRRLGSRLDRLEAVAGEGDPRPTPVLLLDCEGKILGNGRKGMEQWEGRHVSEWPQQWWGRPRPMVLLLSVDPQAPPDLGCLARLRRGSFVIAKRVVGRSLADL
jgi:hypothetical protein